MAASQVSGGDIYTKKIIEHSGFDFDVILSENASNIISGNGLQNVHVTDNKTAKGSLSLLVLYTKRIVVSLKILKRTPRDNYDAVIASSPFMHDILPVAFYPSRNRIVVLYHIIPNRKGSNIATRFRFWLARLEQKLAFIVIRKYFNSIMAGNEEVKKELGLIFPGKQIVVAHAGIDTKKIDNIPDTEKDDNLAIFVGRLTIQKGIIDLVEIVKAVSDELPNLRLKIIGDGPDRQLLENEIKRLSIKNIELVGFISDAQKYKLMKQAKYFLFPSKEEGWGIALAEALYTGCIAICYELPHYRGIFADYPYYVELNNKKAFSRVLLDANRKRASLEQIKFIHQYDDSLIVKNVLSQLI